MTSTLITSEELKDLTAEQLQSKFFRVHQDVERLPQGHAADADALVEPRRPLGCWQSLEAYRNSNRLCEAHCK